VIGLDAGADELRLQAVPPGELLARIRALVRRADQEAMGLLAEREADVLRVGDLTVDVGARIVKRAGEPVALTPKEFDLLALLVSDAAASSPASASSTRSGTRTGSGPPRRSTCTSSPCAGSSATTGPALHHDRPGRRLPLRARRLTGRTGRAAAPPRLDPRRGRRRGGRLRDPARDRRHAPRPERGSGTPGTTSGFGPRSSWRPPATRCRAGPRTSSRSWPGHEHRRGAARREPPPPRRPAGAAGRPEATSVVRPGVVVAARATSSHTTSRIRDVWLAVGAGAALALVVAWLLARQEVPRLARPLQELAAVSERLGAGTSAPGRPRAGSPRSTPSPSA